MKNMNLWMVRNTKNGGFINESKYLLSAVALNGMPGLTWKTESAAKKIADSEDFLEVVKFELMEAK